MVRLRYFQSLTWVTGGTEFIPYVNCRKQRQAMHCLVGWVQDSSQALKLIPGHPLAQIYTLQKVRSKFDILKYGFLGRACCARSQASQAERIARARVRCPASQRTSGLEKTYLRMSKFDLTFCKVYIYARGWPGINLGASHESCTHPNI